MMKKVTKTVHIKGVCEMRQYGIYVDGVSLVEIIRAAMENKDVENRPCDIWVGITLDEQGVDVR